jgi:hypothetical protein
LVSYYIAGLEETDLEFHILRDFTILQLVEKVTDDGFVAFTSGRCYQRKIASEVCSTLNIMGISATCLEANSGNWPMCIVDTNRENIFEILKRVEQIDDTDDETI